MIPATYPIVRLVLLATSLFCLNSCYKPDPAEVRARNNLPEASYVADVSRGNKLFKKNCGICHGTQLQGSQQGPSLLHKTYYPDHHADLAIFWAIKKGVIQHHWKFGNMPPQPQINAEQSADIVAYIRLAQRSN